MNEQRWLCFALGVATVMGLGAAKDHKASRAPAGLTLSDTGIVFADGTEQTTAATGLRSFYLTTTEHLGGPGPVAGPLEACAAGYHMASIWEISDPSNLRYDTARGEMTLDSGEGPPQFRTGWIRTGDELPASDIVGLAACGTASGGPWTDITSIRNGTWVSLGDPETADWNSPASRISPWEAGTTPCNFEKRVWCVED